MQKNRTLRRVFWCHRIKRRRLSQSMDLLLFRNNRLFTILSGDTGAGKKSLLPPLFRYPLPQRIHSHRHRREVCLKAGRQNVSARSPMLIRGNLLTMLLRKQARHLWPRRRRPHLYSRKKTGRPPSTRSSCRWETVPVLARSGAATILSSSPTAPRRWTLLPCRAPGCFLPRPFRP